jgi:hypothetical protein
VARDDSGVAAGSRTGVASGVGLRAAGRVVTPGDRSRNRSAVKGNAVWGGRERSSLADRRACRRIFPEFGLGAGPRRPGRAWWVGWSWVVARARPRVARARLEEDVAVARGQSCVVADGCGSVAPGRSGVVSPERWSCNSERHASAAIAAPRAGKPDYRTEPGADWAGTSVHTL